MTEHDEGIERFEEIIGDYAGKLIERNRGHLVERCRELGLPELAISDSSESSDQTEVAPDVVVINFAKAREHRQQM